MIVPHQRTWIRLIFTVRGSTLPRIGPRLVVITASAFLVTWSQISYDFMDLDLTTAPFTLVGVALGIFLGFRTNTAYDRFWEGRKLWGRLVNDSRSFTREILTLIRSPASGSASATSHELHMLHRGLVYRVIAFVHALRLHLREEQAPDELAEFLKAEDRHALTSEHNVPIAILQQLGDQLRGCYDRGLIHPYHLPLLEGMLVRLTDIQGACERIKATPIPYSYTVLIHRIVAIYCFTLPFGLVKTAGSVTPLIVLIVSYALLGLDAVGDEIENPFGHDPNDLPLTTLSRMIEVNLLQRLGEPVNKLPAFLSPIESRLD